MLAISCLSPRVVSSGYYGVQGGLVVDYLHDDWLAVVDLSQIRVNSALRFRPVTMPVCALPRRSIRINRQCDWLVKLR